MKLQVACTSCGATFPARSHAGLVRCAPCSDRAIVLPAAGPTVVELGDEVWT